MRPITRQPPRPLAGLKVLDLTRVLAGPVATRFLAGYGAQVLRIDPPDWDEPALIPEITLGKRCARLDLRISEDRALFERLLSEADVLVHGYRPGALDTLGYNAAAVVRSLQWRIAENKATTATLSLARTAHALMSMPRIAEGASRVAVSDADFQTALEHTCWGPAKRCRSPISVNGIELSWQKPASPLGSAQAIW